MTSEWAWFGGPSGGGTPPSRTRGKASPDPDPTRACRECCAYLAFRREDPSAIDASDQVEYTVHLVLSHGFAK